MRVIRLISPDSDPSVSAELGIERVFCPVRIRHNIDSGRIKGDGGGKDLRSMFRHVLHDDGDRENRAKMSERRQRWCHRAWCSLREHRGLKKLR
jgi:hypothetical protein